MKKFLVLSFLSVTFFYVNSAQADDPTLLCDEPPFIQAVSVPACDQFQMVLPGDLLYQCSICAVDCLTFYGDIETDSDTICVKVPATNPA